MKHYPVRRCSLDLHMSFYRKRGGTSYLALHHVARGDAFALIPETKILTPNEAARMLNVSRPFLVQLLSKGEIKFTKVGAHHRLVLGDVLEYKQRRDRQMLNALDQLACEA